MNERLMRDVTTEYDRMRNTLMLVRMILGLNPAHDVRLAVQELHDNGREAFEKLRGPRCDHAHTWEPH